MNIFEYIKMKLNKRKIKALNEKNIDYNETMEIITIDAIEDILNNPTTLEMFKDYNNNLELFGENTKKEHYIRAIKEYFEAKSESNIELSKIEKLHYEVITGEKIQSKIFMSKEKKRDKEAKAIAFEILSSNEKAKEFEKIYINHELDIDKNLIKKGITKNEIMEAVLEWDYSGNIRSFCKDEIVDTIFGNCYKYRELYNMQKNGERPNKVAVLNTKFEEAIMEKIPEDLDDISKARAIYIELNKRVQYSEEFAFQNQDLSKDFVNQIYNRDIQTITVEDNKITCNNWSELYSHLLQKNNIQSSIMKKGKHKFVQMYVDGEIYSADATNVTYTEGIKMSDLERAKCGMKPEGFEMIERIKDLTEVDKTDPRFDEVDLNLGYEFTPTKINDDVEKLLERFEDKNISFDIEQLKEKYESIVGNLLEIFEKLENSSEISGKLTGLEKYNYYSNIIGILGQPYTQITSGFISEIYTVNDNNEFELVPTMLIIDINKDNNSDEYTNISAREAEGVTYEYLVVNNNGIQRKNNKEFNKEIEQGKYFKHIKPKKEKTTEINKDNKAMGNELQEER